MLSQIIDDYAQSHRYPEHLLKEMGELGLPGPFIPEKYGGAGLDQISYGLIMQELEAGDSSIRSSVSVQSSLVMYPIYSFGSDEQIKKYIPKLAIRDMVGCFGLTETNHGHGPRRYGNRIKQAKWQIYFKWYKAVDY